MVSMRNLAIAASAMVGLTAAAPAIESRQTFVPGKINNTQEFYIAIDVVSGRADFQNLFVETYHTGAGLADPVFTNSTAARAAAFLNGTSLQFDTGFTPFAMDVNLGDTNYARWEQVTIGSGYGVGTWEIDSTDGLIVSEEEFGGWLVCEWFHGVDAPQLFSFITGFNTDSDTIPSSCANVRLYPQYF